ncbi:hypothetical protein PRQG_00037 [Prochlorococcus phage P-GSP1]|uniref:Uncharacterized protein n=1 Tax=Prochlorococcus phage P-GSP1 TaxID=382262 RepID=M1T3G8_9CAUD|nr:hypothetical protein PRQG_00037 [Prochlorococcus phage P-GSP1]AGG54640.1 hypothetical protein PRQG_00037 [Prochlorococcus phage P-GSP1]
MAIHAPSAHNIVQSVKFTLPQYSVYLPAYGNNNSNYRQWSNVTVSITPKFANSHIIIWQKCEIQGNSSHGYLTWKRGGTSGTWLHTDTSAGGASGSDGLYVNHDNEHDNYESSVVIFEDSDPGYTLGNSITYVPYIAFWAADTFWAGSYQNNGNGQVNQGYHGYLQEIAYT